MEPRPKGWHTSSSALPTWRDEPIERDFPLSVREEMSNEEILRDIADSLVARFPALQARSRVHKSLLGVPLMQLRFDGDPLRRMSLSLRKPRFWTSGTPLPGAVLRVTLAPDAEHHAREVDSVIRPLMPVLVGREWRRAHHDGSLVFMAVAALAMLTLINFVFVTTWPWTLITYLFGFGFFLFLLRALRHDLARVWNSPHKGLECDPELLMPRLKAALDGAGLGPATDREKVSATHHVAIDLGNDLTITYMAHPGKGALFVGPETSANHGQVERVKGVVDAVLEGLEREKSPS